ncbi:MAG: DUF1156 domain-containing protein [Propionibacteriaceae bacterium]|jgi:putative DNA methylase|nr:DUF1156 domain-containing protein [Propionibacteriaceae bacterium]
MTERKKKLIEVGLPLEKINAESAREKSIRHGHPSTLHLWWSRKPTATARAVLFAQLVDDPSAHPEQFPTQETQDAERKRLHDLIEKLVVWENTNDTRIFKQATEEIKKSNGGVLPAVLDPFAGGGSIPLEVQRLGLEAHASDLNPVAVLINKALIEIPPKFAERPPVHPEPPQRMTPWERAEGLAEDVRYYGQWMRYEAFKRIGHLYPTVTGPDGKEHTVIAWKWARTVHSPNPANPIEVPLVNSWWLGKKKGKEAWVKASVVDGQVQYEVMHDADGPKGDSDWTIKHGKGAKSVADGTGFDYEYVRQEGKAGRIGSQLIAVVAEGARGRLYVTPTTEQIEAARTERPALDSDGEIADNPRWFSPPAYGMAHFSDLFTNRQLVAMTTFSDLVAEAREQVFADALAMGMIEGARLEDGGADAAAYADVVSVYLGLSFTRTLDRHSAVSTWDNSTTKEQVRGVFARQAVPMAWDFAEGNWFSSSSGNIADSIGFVAEVLERLPVAHQGYSSQKDAGTRAYAHMVVSTDPPYYDNIGYSDLSDFFYIWQKRSLESVLPRLFGTVLTPKADELVANPYRHDGKTGAEQFFVSGFNSVFARIRHGYNGDLDKLLTVYYAYKQQDAGSDGTASTGWYTLLDGLIRSGWEITATWPVRSELSNRMLAGGTNALASSIVLACRPRLEDAPATTRRSFLALLKSELPASLRAMMQGAVAPVDLAQAAIGPGMSIFSRYSRVREADGSDMSVRDALLLINATLDEVMDEQEGDYDPDTRFAIKWYRTYGWGTEASGTADTLARATGTSPSALERGGIFEAKGGKARLLSPKDLAGEWNPEADERVSVWEAVVRLAAAMESEGATKVASLLPAVGAKVSLDMVKELGFLLFHEAERKSDTQDAILFNALVSSWSELSAQAQTLAAQPHGIQDTLDFGGEA